MTNLQFDLAVRKTLRHRPFYESAILEALEFADAEVDRLEKARATTDEMLANLDSIDEKIERQLKDPDPVERAEAQHGKTRSTVMRMKHHATLEKIEWSVKSRGAEVRQMIQKYVACVENLEDSILTGSLQVQANEDAQENSRPGLLDQLGMVLFAAKSSNAFDDLHAIRKSLGK